jgi:hypothetical protein
VRIGKIALKIRTAKTSFGEYVAGSAELDTAMQNTLNREMAFVLPLIESADENMHDNGVSQALYERFGVLVCLKNDDTQSDKIGIIAYDRIHDIREEFFNCLLGWEMTEAESMVYYRGGSLIDINGGWLWYQFEFEYKSRIGVIELFNSVDSDGDATGLNSSRTVYGLIENPVNPDEEPTDFDTIYANFILAPSDDLPYTGDLPLADGFPNVSIPDMATLIDLTDDPRSGAYTKGFASAFDFYKR